MVLLLEDNPDRIGRFKAVLATINPRLQVHVWSDARKMISEAAPHLHSAHLIALDHDLDPRSPSHEPGDGLEVAKFLVAQPIIRPVIIHSSNSDRARMMQGEFELAGWPCTRVLPLGDDWIETEWLDHVATLLRSPAMPNSLSFPDRFRNWYAYERDCNAKVLTMLESVPAGNRSDPNFQRAIDKFAHLIAARQIWLYRLGLWPERAATFFPQGTTLIDLPPRLAAIEQAWTTYLASLDEAKLLSDFTFTTSTGDTWKWNVLDLLTQVFGHAWYHRGQIATLVADLGGKIIDTDYVYWCGTPQKLPPQA